MKAGGLIALFLTGCAMRAPVVADVRCPKNATMITAPGEGRCVLADGKRHGPSWSASDAGVTVEGYDHDVPAGPYERWDARGRVAEEGFRPGVTDSMDPQPDVGPAKWDAPKTNGTLVWPGRVRLFPVQADVAFAASTLVSSEGKPTSSFVGAAVDVALTPDERVRHRGDAYQAWFVAYGAQGLAGAVARSACDDPTVAGSGGFCGSRWMAGPFVRVGYFRTSDARPSAALPSLLAYGRIGFVLGEDRWSSNLSSGSELVWRLRVGAGYTAFGAVADLARRASENPAQGWRWLLLPLAIVLEHAEGFVELGGDGGSALGVGGGVDLGFGL
ncbi:MAG TPA: hypothetical protein VGH28_24105 [Polyangiaceae bacterium]